MAQMAGYDFSVVTPLRRPVTDEERLQEQDRLIAQGADPMALAPEDRALADRPLEPLPELMPDPLAANDRIMPGLYNPQERAAIEAARNEPYQEPALPTEDDTEPLPPVQTAPIEGYDFSNVTPIETKAEAAAAEPFDFSKVQPLPGPAGSSQLAYDTTVRPENVEGPIPFGEKDRPYRTRSDGTLEFDPRRMKDGVTQALKDQVITGEQFAKLQPAIEQTRKVLENEAKLRARAKDNGALASALQGFGRGGAMTLGAIGGSKAGAAAGLLTGPYAPVASPVLGLVGGAAGAVTMGMNYDLVYKELAKHYDEYDSVLAAAELNPGWNKAGELVTVAVGVPQALRGAGTALSTTLSREGAGAVARQVGTAAGLGAGSGVAGYSLDRTVRGEPITPGGLATAAAAGAAFAPFMITPGEAGTQQMANITAKMRAGQPLSPMEMKIYEAAAPAMRAAFAEMDAAGGRYTGGRYDAAGKWIPGIEVKVPTSSVMGLAPAAGKATVRLPYEVPPRLGAPAVAKAQALATRGAAGERTAGPAVPTGETAPVRAPRPTEAPVNVLPPGPTIVTPTQAMLGVEEFLARQVGVRGIQTKGNFEAILELMDEHKQIVTDAIGRNEPVSIDALDSYEIRVPYYDRDEETGLATYNDESFKAYEAYLRGQDAEGAENVRAGGIDIFEAIRDSGGLPSGKSDKIKQWAGELKRIREAQNPGNALGVKGALNLFRKDAPDLDGLIKNLQGYGFQVTTPAELFDLIDQRFKTGKPIYAYGAEEPLEMRGRRRPPAPGAPRQGELLGESDVEFSLVGQTDRTSLTPAEQAAAAKAEADRAEAEKGQGDLFGASDPLPARAGGPAQVPPGTPIGMAALNPPDWVMARGETSQGRRLIKGITNYRPGQKWAFGHIVGMLNKAVQVEMRRTTSQVTRRHPAHYLPINKVFFTDNTQSQINFHEAGHQLQYMLQDRVPDIWKAHESELTALTKRPGSMASDPPANANAIQKRNYILGEGVAEWLRLLMVDPSAVQGMPVSKTISDNADKFYPGMARQIRDAARAMNAFINAPDETKIGMGTTLPTEPVTANSIISAIEMGKEGLGNKLASGAPIDRARVKILKAIMKNRRETGLSLRQAIKVMERVSQKLNQPIGAYNMILSIDQEVQLAYSGKGPAKGLRVMDENGKLIYFTKWTWNDLRDRVPRKFKVLFDQAAWALENYERYKRKGNEYPLMREGLTPEKLLGIVKEAQDTIPGFGQMFAEQSNFLHSVNEIREFGGILSAEERQRIQFSRPTYWPLPRQFKEGRISGGKSGSKILRGVYVARGSGEPTKPVDEAALEAIQQVMTSYYWNRFANVSMKRFAEVTKMKGLPWEARQLAGAMFVRLKVPYRKVAELNENEMAAIKKDVIGALADNLQTVLGFRPEIDPKTVHVAFSAKEIYRPMEPGDTRVLAHFENGERVFTQIGDPALFAMIAAGNNPGMAKYVKGFFGPASRNVMRIITTNPYFGVPGNLARDILSQMLQNPQTDAVDWIPGYTHLAGVWNKFTKKYPQVFNEGLLLSRNQPTDSELLSRAKHSELWSFLMQSFYVAEDKDPTKRLLKTIFNPNFPLYPFFLAGDIANAVTPGASLGAMAGGALAGPPGALVGGAAGAVLGPALGFTGASINAFIETAGREGAAVRTLQGGGTDEEALKQYWMRSGQFNERPGVADLAQLLKVIPFANPSVQSTRNGIQALADPNLVRRFTAWTRLIYTGVILASAYAVIRYLTMSEEERNKERDRTIEDRLGYMDIGGIRVPYAYGVEGAVQSLVSNMIMDDLLERRADPNKYFWGAAKRIFDPQGLMVGMFGPQIAAYQETKANWSNWRQKPIISPWMVNLPASEQYYSTTPEFYRKIGKMFDWSPAKLQYFVQQAITRQIDETVRLVEGVSGGKPFMERADMPFVGRLFIRDPIGFASQSVRDLDGVDARLRMLNTRLSSKGWGSLGQFNQDGEPTVLAEDFAAQLGIDGKLKQDLVHVQQQLQYLQGLKSQLGAIDKMQAFGKAYALNEDYANERNMRTLMTIRAQAVMAGNREWTKLIDATTESLERLAPASPQMQAVDYLNRRF